MDKERISYLWQQLEQGSLSPAEEQELDAAITDPQNEPAFLDVIATNIAAQETAERFANKDYSAMIERIVSIDRGMGKDGQETTPVIEMERKRFPLYKWLAAASIILLLGIGGLWLLNKPAAEPPVDIVQTTHDVKAPVSNRAMVTLGNGTNVYLDSAKNGALAAQGKLHIVKLADGKIAYAPDTDAGPGEVMYNTLSNPRGSRPIDLTLSDGTRVWLNAESSLTYPTAFAGNDRKVEITGEAYFEVAHDKTKPFLVTKGTVTVQVLGTHFNVDAYKDETELKVTLLEGSVKVSVVTPNGVKRTTEKSVTIKPGEQAIIDGGKEAPGGVGEGGQLSIDKGVDINQVMAWKNGRFDFEGMKLGDAMRQMKRWYDITVLYKDGKVPDIEFFGALSRDKSLASVLDALKDSGVHFTIEGKTLTISK